MRAPSLSAECKRLIFRSCRSGVDIDFDRFIKPSGFREHSAPIGFQSFAMIENSALRMAQNMDVFVAQGRDLAVSLILASSECGVKGADDEIKFAKHGRFNINFT